MVKLLCHYSRVSYKYLGILEADKCLGEDINLKVSKEYFRKLKKALSQS